MTKELEYTHGTHHATIWCLTDDRRLLVIDGIRWWILNSLDHAWAKLKEYF
jgi:hypothetical protein